MRPLPRARRAVRRRASPTPGTARRAVAGVASLTVLVAGALTGCSLGNPGLACTAVDSAAISSPEHLAHSSDAVVRGHVEGVVTPGPGGTSGVLAETYTLQVDQVVGVARGITAPAVGSVLFVEMNVLDPRCGGATPTAGYTDFPLVGEVPAAGTTIIAFLDMPKRQVGVPDSLGYASVTGDHATFEAVTGDLRGKTYDVTDVEHIAAQGLAAVGASS